MGVAPQASRLASSRTGGGRHTAVQGTGHASVQPDAPIAERSTYHHPVGTCRMGPPGDPDAVVAHGLREPVMVGAHTVMGSGLRESSGPAPDERNVGKSEPGDPG